MTQPPSEPKPQTQSCQGPTSPPHAGSAGLITTTVENGIATITFNRAEKLNSFNRPMAVELLSALRAASESHQVRVIVITANGKAFCAGQDLSEVIPSDGTTRTQAGGPASSQLGSGVKGDSKRLDLGAIVAELYNPIIQCIVNAPKPVIAAVAGVAAGAGANLALACDFVVAAENAVFIQAFSKVGLIPDSGGTFFLPRLVGLARAKALTFLGEKIKAQELLNLGAIYKVTSDVELHSAVNQLAATLAGGATHALGLTKQLLNNSLNSSLSEQLTAEEHGQRTCGFSEDYKIGVTAFLEKKSPEFLGR